jgi:hypothetical protein
VDPGEVMLNARTPTDESGPVPHTVSDGESEPVTLTLHPRRKFTAWVASPSGSAVAGAVVRLSDGYSLREEITGPGGDVRFAIARGIDSVDMIIAATGFPIRMMNLPISADMEPNPQIVLGGASALLVAKFGGTPPWPGLRPMQGNVKLHYLYEFFASPRGGPSTNRTARGYEFEIDPGSYLLCPDSRTPAKCIERTLSPGTETIVDFESLRPRETGK